MHRCLRALLVGTALAASLVVSPARAAAGGPDAYPNGHLLVDAAWLRARLGDPALRVVDLRTAPAYAAGHVPGAVNFQVEALRTTAVDVLEGRLGRAGIAPQNTVVLYDDQGGLAATRMFLALEYLGHDRMHVLNGGFQAWMAAGGPVVREGPPRPAAIYTGRPRPDVIATKADVLAGLKDPGRVLVDARTGPEFHGRDVRAARGGHIPGARHVEWTQNLRQGSGLSAWKPAADLQALYAAAGAMPGKEIVTYCQTHSRAAHTYFTLRLLGYERLKAYLASWEEWGNDPTLPIE